MIPVETVAAFFLVSAFLPQFADPARGPLTLQLMMLGGIFIIATILVFGGISLLAGAIGQWLTRSPKTQVIINRLAAVVFVGLAVKLATVRR
jgi:threonine/homoserine/homoserine lactone efflux protein